MLTDRFHVALGYAELAHRNQNRKGSDIPYVAHLLGVCSLVLEHGGDEDQAIAALLHDAVEDQGGLERLKEIDRLFGARVAMIVKDCSDAFEVPKPPWKERKVAYLNALKEHDPASLLVSCADKLFNARSVLRDYREEGETVWQRFNGGREGTLWYYRAVANEFKSLLPGSLSNELETTVQRLEALADAARRASERTRPQLTR